jgi:voltage-gated potassium channel
MRQKPKYIKDKSGLKPWQHKMHEVIYEADTFAGKTFDIGLLIIIILSISVVMLESVPSLQKEYGNLFTKAEWVFTIIFTLEYIARLISIRKPFKYIFSFYGIIDFLSIIPTYLGIFISGTNSLMVIRSLRLMRVFRILKLGNFLNESRALVDSLKASRHKIAVFLLSILTMVIVLGTIMYLIETPESGFTSIPRSIYWAIVTLTTVGYGDIAPTSPLGQFIASIVMILGYAIIAVPTGIVTSEIIKSENKKELNTLACVSCSKDGHESDADFCKHCGEKL